MAVFCHKLPKAWLMTSLAVVLQKAELSPARPEPACFTAGISQIVNYLNCPSQHRIGNQIGDFVASMDDCRRITEILQKHPDLAAITGINHAAGQGQAARRHR